MKTKSPVNLVENQEQMIVNQDLIVMSVEDRGMKEGEVQTEVEEDMMTIGEDMKMIEDIAMTEIENEDGEGIFFIEFQIIQRNTFLNFRTRSRSREKHRDERRSSKSYHRNGENGTR